MNKNKRSYDSRCYYIDVLEPSTIAYIMYFGFVNMIYDYLSIKLSRLLIFKSSNIFNQLNMFKKRLLNCRSGYIPWRQRKKM